MRSSKTIGRRLQNDVLTRSEILRERKKPKRYKSNLKNSQLLCSECQSMGSALLGMAAMRLLY